MKRFIIILTIFAVAFVFISCTIPDEDPGIVPEPEFSIECDGGHYQGYFSDWQRKSCPNAPVYPKGTYWVNADGTMFLVGSPVINVFEVYGVCPVGYSLIILPEEE